MKPKLAPFLCVLAAAIWSAPAEDLTYRDLVARLTDMEHLAVLPAAGESTAQFSSYDRKSRFDTASGKYLNWDANGDGDGIIRKEGDQLVLAEMKGPGCIWRIWSADPKQGRVKIFIDGKPEPAVDLPFKEYFDLSRAPFDKPALVHTVSRGWNNYVPIPYQQSCKVVADPGWGLYYQFVYQKFAPGTRVPSFNMELNAEDRSSLQNANRALQNPVVKRPGDKAQEFATETPAGKESVVCDLKGPAAISHLRLRLDQRVHPAEAFEVLRQLAIQIQWDGESQPSVWAPVADFFGTFGDNTYRSLPAGHTGDEWWYVNWYMPYQRSARISVRNDSVISRGIHWEVVQKPLSRPIATLGRFHAKWHRDALLPKKKERAIDWPVLVTGGRGRFAGMMLHVWNPRGGWWGEGDEKFFVDGERFPSTFGTGSEDYFGYAWCDPGLFENAYHNQTFNTGNNKGHISVNRWHVPDNIPFHTSFTGCIEKYFPNTKPTLYASTAFWYLAPGGDDPYSPVAVSERSGYWVPVQPQRKPGVLEGESLKIIRSSGGNPHEQELSGFEGTWSNDAHLWWISARPGDRLELSVPVASDGNYNLSAQFTKARDYGIVQLSLDGEKLGAPMDFYHTSVVPTGPVLLRTGRLTAGEHNLTVEITGSNDSAIKSFMFGLDYLKLQLAK